MFFQSLVLQKGKTKVWKKVLKILGIILLIIVLLIAAAVAYFVSQLNKAADDRAANQAAMVKSDEDLLGEHFYVPREGQDPVDVNLYIPEEGDNLPVVFHLHGGAFIAGDADTLDSLSLRLSQDWNAVIVTVNYKLAVDGISIEYGTQEVVDTVKYFLDHAAEYRIDPHKAVLMGYSAGGCHGALAALALERDGVDLAAQVLCYSFIGGVLETLPSLSQAQQAALPPTLFVLADNDPISEGSLEYEEKLREAGIQTEVKKYDGAIHGFIEENNPEYESLPAGAASKSPEQEVKARDAEQFIGTWLKGIL